MRSGPRPSLGSVAESLASSTLAGKPLFGLKKYRWIVFGPVLAGSTM